MHTKNDCDTGYLALVFLPGVTLIIYIHSFLYYNMFIFTFVVYPLSFVFI